MRPRVAIVAVAALFAACASGVQISGDRRDFGSVTETFRVEPSRIRAGQPLQLTLRLVNNSGRPERLTFATTQRYDFWITSGGTVVWRWSDGRVFAQSVTTQTIEGQGGSSVSEHWLTATPGTYIAHGEIRARGYEGDLTGTVKVQ